MNRKSIIAWVMYDWANSAFATTIMAAVLPIFYYDVAFKGYNQSMASAYWGYSQSIAMLIVALVAPILGAVADCSDSKKKFLMFFTYLGVLACILLASVNEGEYLWASILMIVGTIGFAGGNAFYDAFLPEITTKENIDRISAWGYAVGYIGGGILLLVNLLMIMKPQLFHIKNSLAASHLAFVSVGIWWFVFSIPMFRYVKEGTGSTSKDNSYIKEGFNRLKQTFKEIKKYKELFKFLVAFWLFNDGIATIMKMATIYGRDIGIGVNDLITALLITQFLGIPCALIFGYLARKITAKTGLLIALSIYVGIVIGGYFMQNAVHFYLLAVGVGLVQGGAQALSRSIYGSMTPANRHGEFFGFYGVFDKFSAIVGPFLFAIVGQITGSSRFGIISLLILFLSGIFLLTKVNVEEGQNQSRG